MVPRGPAAPERKYEFVPWRFEENVETEAANESSPTRDDGHSFAWRLDYTHASPPPFTKQAAPGDCLRSLGRNDMFGCRY